MQCAEAGDPDGLWLVADVQTKGRGRTKRTWISQPGNLFASYYTNFSAPAYKVPGAPLVAGIALYDAVETLFGERTTLFNETEIRSDEAESTNPANPLSLKWPNDLLCGGAKLAGILIETTSSPTPGLYPVIFGFGLNIKSAPQLSDRETTSLIDQKLDVTPAHALEVLASSLDHWLGVWQEGRGMNKICEAAMERSVPMGSRLRVSGIKGDPIEGRFAGLNEQGALLLDSGGKIRTVTFGDVDILN